MRGWRRPALAWLALAVYFAPAPALAQATKAGVVTTLEGNVTAVRAVAPQPVALKFKDDVFLQDRVVTGEQSFARLLLGGKAVVSIRERSAVTITEIPGRSTIDVENGKIALSVARDRMQPGEVINIKMPNAVAGVRGTVVIAEVSYAMVGGAQQAISSLAVLRGQVEAVHTNAAGAAIGVPVMVGAMQKFSATPTTASTGTFTVEQIGGIVQGLQSKGAADPGTASQAPARLEAVNTAVALLTALTGTSGSQAVQYLATGPSPDLTTSNDSKVEVKTTEAGDLTSSVIIPGGTGTLPELPPPPPAPMNMTTLSSGQSLLTFTGDQVQSSDGTLITPTTDPLLSRTSFTITQQGADDLVVVKSDATITPLPGPLMKLTDTSVQAGHAFLSVAGSVTSTSPQPFIDLDPTTVTAPGNFAEVIGPSAVLGLLAGGLVRDMGGTMNVGGSVVAVSEGGTLTSTGTGPLVQLNGTTMTASSLLSVVGSGSSANLNGTLLAAQGGSLTILARGLGGGDLLRASAATVSLGRTLLDSQNTAVSLAGAVATMNNGSHLVQEAGPFVSVRGGSFSADALLRADGLGNTFAFTGTVLDLTDTNVSLGLIADFPDQGTDSATLLLAPGEPAARVTRSTLRIDRGPFVSLVSAAETGCSQCAGVGIFSGVALISTGTAAAPSSITVRDELVALGTVDFVGNDPIAQLTRTTVQQTGDGSAFISWFPDATFGTRLTTKPLLRATDSNLDVPGRAIFQYGGGRLVAATNGPPFLSMTNTLVKAGWLVDALSGQLEVAGPLAAFSGGSSAISGALLSILGGAAVVTSAATPTVSIAGGTHQFGWVFQLENTGVTESQVVTGFSPSPDVTLRLGTSQPLRQDSGVLQAPLLSVSNATIDATTGLRLDTVRLDTFSRLFDFTNSTVTGGSLGFIDLARSARLVATIPDAGLVNLFQSSMTLSGNALARPTALAQGRGAPTTGGSLLQIGTPTAGSSLVSMSGGSTLKLLTNAALLSVTDGAAAQIFGSLIAFVGTGNTVTVDNNLCAVATLTCVLINGVRVARGQNVALSSIRIEINPISGLAGNTLTVGTDDALILIDGADSRLLIAGTGADVPDLSFNDAFIPGHTLKLFSGVSNRAGVSPVILITGGSVFDGSDFDLVVVDRDADATLQAGPLMKVTNSTIDAARLLLVRQGSLTSFGTAPLIALDPVTVNAQTLVEVVAGGKLSLAGPLLTDLGGRISTRQDAFVVAGTLTGSGPTALVGLQGTTLNVGIAASQASLFRITGPVTLAGGILDAIDARVTADGFGVRVEGGSVVVAGTTSPLINLSGTAPGANTITTSDQLVRLSGSPATSMTLSGQLLSAFQTTITTGNPTRNTAGLITVHDGATLTSTALIPLVSLDHSTADLGGTLLGVRRSPPAQSPSMVSLSDRLLRAVDSTVSTTTAGFDANFGTTFHGTCCSVLSVQQGARLVTTRDVPLFDLVGSRLSAGPDARSGGSIFNVRDTFNGAPVGELVSPATATLAGQVLFTQSSATASTTVSALFDLIQVWRSTLTSTTTKPLIELGAGTQLALGGTNPLSDPPATTTARLLDVTAGVTDTVNGPVGPGPALVSLVGPLLSSVNATISATDDLVGLFEGARLESRTTDPLLSITGGSVKLGTGGSLFTMTSAAGQAGSTTTLQNTLLKATGTTLQSGTPGVLSSGSPNFFAFADGATLTQTTPLGAQPQPLVSLTNTLLDSAGNFLDIRRNASVIINGPLLTAVDSTIDTTTLGFGTSNCCHGIRLGQGGSLIGTGPAPLVQLTRSTFNAGPDAQSGGFFVRLVDVGTVATDLPSRATISLAGPLLVSTDSFVTALNSFLTVERSTFTATTTEPLVEISGTPASGQALHIGGLNPLSTPTPNADTLSRFLFVSGGTTTNPGPAGPANASVSLAGPLLSANSAGMTLTGDVIALDNGGVLLSNTASPLITLTAGSSLKAGTTAFSADILEVGGLGGNNAATPGSVTLHGPLLAVSGSSTIDLTGRLLNVFDGGQVTVQGTTAPLVSLTGGSYQLSTTTTTSTSQFSISAVTAGAPPSSVSVSGPLFSANQANITLASQTPNAAGTTTSGMLFVGDSSTLTSLTPDPLFTFDGVTYTAPNLMSMRRSKPTSTPPTTISLKGPLLEATNSSFFLGSGGNGPTGVCCTPFFVSQGTQLTSTALQPLIQLTGSTFDNRDAVRSGSDFFAVTDTFTGATTANEFIGPSSVVLAGGLLRASNNSAIETLTQLANVVRSTFKSTGTDPLIDLTATSVTLGFSPNPFSTPPNQETIGRLLNVFAGSITSPVALPSADASVSLKGPLLLASAGSTLTMTDVIGIFRGASVVREAGSPETAFIGIDASRLEAGRNANAAAGVTNVDGSVANITGVGGTSGTTQSSLTLNSGGALLETKNGAFVDVRGANGNVIRLDAALLDATSPVIALIGAGTRLQTSNHAVSVNNNATIESRAPSDALVRIDSQARMDVLSGHLVNVSASRLNVAGDLIRIGGGSQPLAPMLSVTNGVLLSVLNGGIANINGALVNFTGSNGLISVTNTLAPTNFINGVPIFVGAGANINNVSIGAGALAGLNVNGNTIMINNTALSNSATAATGSLISVVGANSTVKIVGRP